MRPTGVRGELLQELDIAQYRIRALAELLPSDKYNWRPHTDARSASEVLVHLATGNFFLLDVIGMCAPTDIYFQVAASGPERTMELIRRNQELERTVCHKDGVLALLTRAFSSARQAMLDSTEIEFERRLEFIGEETTVRRVYLRLLVHTHEHMGQMLAYLRSNGIAPPAPSWRPDSTAPLL